MRVIFDIFRFYNTFFCIVNLELAYVLDKIDVVESTWDAHFECF